MGSSDEELVPRGQSSHGRAMQLVAASLLLLSGVLLVAASFAAAHVRAAPAPPALRARALAPSLNVSAARTALQPALGSCYLGLASAFEEPVRLWRLRRPQEALALLKAMPGTPALHLAMDIGQMHDLDDVVHASAAAILEVEPGDAHANFVAGLYAAADEQMPEFRRHVAALRHSNREAAAALDTVVADVALAWSSRSYPPSGPHELPSGWAPEDAVVMVFGYPVLQDGQPSPALAGQLRATLEVAKALPNASIIASGGPVSSGYEEGAYIQAWLMKRGLDGQRLWVDARARDTVGNAMYLRHWLKAHPTVQSVVLLSGSWHSPRCRLIVEGMLHKDGLAPSLVSVGTGNADYSSPDELAARIRVERKASYRDAARARGHFEMCAF